VEEPFLSTIECTWDNDARQTEVHSAERLVPEPNAFEVEMAIEKLKSCKSPGTDQIPAELIKSEVEQFVLRLINLLYVFGIRSSCLRSKGDHQCTCL
jgi:hypothetical protein